MTAVGPMRKSSERADVVALPESGRRGWFRPSRGPVWVPHGSRPARDGWPMV